MLSEFPQFARAGSRAALVLLLLSATLLGQETIDLSNAELIARGSQLFAKSCAVGYCHGSEGRAARGPALRERVWEPREVYRITHDGLPGTSMPAWKDVFSRQDIWAITAYVVSLSGDRPARETLVIEIDAGEAAPAPELTAAASRGRELFFDLTRERRCGVCHQVGPRGTAVGPNLAVSAPETSRGELAEAIEDHEASVAYGFEQVVVRLRDGSQVRGVLSEESDDFVRVFDAAAVPPPLRTIYRDEIDRIAMEEVSSMPGTWAEVYSSGELELILDYLGEF